LKAKISLPTTFFDLPAEYIEQLTPLFLLIYEHFRKLLILKMLADALSPLFLLM